MAFARVVSFEGVTSDRVAQLQQEMGEGDPPEGMSPTEVLMLHDPDTEKSLVIIFFDTEEDYVRGEEILSAMPADDTPGRRTSVTKYEVAARRSMWRRPSRHATYPAPPRTVTRRPAMPAATRSVSAGRARQAGGRRVGAGASGGCRCASGARVCADSSAW